MKAFYLLGIGIGAAMMVAACDSASSNTLDNGTSGTTTKKPVTSGDDDDDSTTTTPAGVSSANANANPSAPPATNSPSGLAFFTASVNPIIQSKCAGCHGSAGPGPNWMTPGDANATYKQLFSQGFVVTQSIITTQPAHGGSTTNTLSSTEDATFNQWVSMELAGGGSQATPNVLAQLGDCFDPTLFNNMKMANWVTTRRTNNNNTNNVTPWNENADNCTGCDNAQCNTCHSADAATGFVNAVGNNLFPTDYTLTTTKTTPYISKFFGVDPTGKPVASDGIKKKSDATMLTKAYSHPMFTLTTAQQTALDAFVQDVITKYNAKTCGQGTTTQQ